MMKTDELWDVLEHYKCVENTSGPEAIYRSHSSEYLRLETRRLKREREISRCSWIRENRVQEEFLKLPARVNQHSLIGPSPIFFEHEAFHNIEN
jgi:hypothetical protein